MNARADMVQEIAASSPHRLVRASAGSGKTFQLTNVLLKRLVEGEDPAGLLATTFTRAAAGEILHRVLARLSAGVLSEDALAELREHVDPDLTGPRCAEVLERVVGDLHRLSVLTIDAFFARMATTFSLELGLAPGWKMLDDQQEQRLRELAVDRALREAEPAESLELLRELQGEEIRTHAHRAIMDVVDAGYAAFLETGGDGPWSAIEPIGRRLGRDELAEAIAVVARLETPLTQAGKPRANWKTNLELARAFIEAGDWKSFVDLTLIKKMIKGEEAFDRVPIEPEHFDAFSPFIDHARHELTREHAERTRAAHRLLVRFDEAFFSLKRRIGGLTFHDPPRLLLEAGALGNLHHLYYRLDARIRHVLLDEFQDTSMTQFRLLEPILDEMLSQAGGRSVFCVGDAKQSLYAWRQAEPTLLPRMSLRWPALLEETLAVSWRSSPAVLDAVNAIFASLSDNEALRSKTAGALAAEDWDLRFDEHVAQRKDKTGAVRLSVADEPEGEPESAERAVLETAVDRVVAISQKAPGASIAVLVRRGRDIAPTLALLKSRGVDASEERGNPLADAPPVAAAVSLLRLIDHPGDTAARRHVATTPLGSVAGLTPGSSDADATREASRLRRRIAERGLARTLTEWRLACAGSMDARGAARFEQLIDLADSLEAAGATAPSELAEIAETNRVEEAGRAPVLVMTIHRSKGLEFDAVVLPLVASKPWNVDPRSVITARDEPLGPVTRASRYPDETLRAVHPELEALHEGELQRQVNEELCCLYVAATRAKRSLDLIVPADKPGRAGQPLPPEKWRLRPDHMVRASLASHRPATPGDTLWSTQTGEDWTTDEEFRSSEEAGAPATTASLLVKPPAARSAARLTGAAPSQQRGGPAVQASQLLRRRDPRGRLIGDLVHGWFERIEWIEDGEPDPAELERQALDRGHGAETVRGALAAFSKAVASDRVREALSREAWLARRPEVQTATVHNERPFAVRDADRLIEGRFDRLVVGRVDGRAVAAEILDFKTDTMAAGLSGDRLADYAVSHAAQMRAYRQAASTLLGLPASRIETTLVFTAAPGVVTGASGPD